MTFVCFSFASFVSYTMDMDRAIIVDHLVKNFEVTQNYKDIEDFLKEMKETLREINVNLK